VRCSTGFHSLRGYQLLAPNDEAWSPLMRDVLRLPAWMLLAVPDPVTAAVCRLAAQDEARHVAFGMAHLREHISEDAGTLPKLANAVPRPGKLGGWLAARQHAEHHRNGA
jgi:hypothetical protein